MSQVYSIGPDEAYCYEDNDNFIWVVEWYEGGSWEGSGEAVALGKDGLLHFANLGHCSCCGSYDGIEGINWGKGVSIEKWKNSLNNVLGYEERDAVTKKVLELLG